MVYYNEFKDIEDRFRYTDNSSRRMRPNMRILREHVMEFCESTSIPGVRYLAEHSRPRHEKFLWMIAVILSVLAFVFLFSKLWRRWKESPVIITMDERQRAVWEIPFPAITICPMTKMRSTLFNYSQVYDRIKNNNNTPEELSLFEDLSLMCDIRLTRESEFRNITVIDRMEKYALPKYPTLSVDSFAQDPISSEAFQELLTGMGMCYTFNMIPGKLFFTENTFHRLRNYLNYNQDEVKWTQDQGYHSSAGIDVYPRRSLGSGRHTGIAFMLRVRKEDLDDLCTETIQGFKILLHAPHELPRPIEKAFLVPLDSAMQVSITPQQVVTDAAMKHKYSVAKRNCYFPGERHLRFFHHYTQNNCQVECLSNITLRMCQCVSFYMPRVINTPICGGGKYKCTIMAKQYLERLNSGLEKPGTLETCDCLQSCYHLEYISQRSRTGLNLDKYSKTVEDSELQWKKWKGSMVAIYFRDTYFVATRRMELFDVYDLLASGGGLLGLCLGMSVLSIFELFYWLFVRPCVVRRRVVPNDKSLQIRPQFDILSTLPYYRKF